MKRIVIIIGVTAVIILITYVFKLGKWKRK
jgi:hypothetical protein